MRFVAKVIVGGFIGFLSAKAGWPGTSYEFWVFVMPVCFVVSLL